MNHDYQQNRSWEWQKEVFRCTQLSYKNKLAALIFRLVIHFTCVLYANILEGECFSWVQNLGAARRERRRINHKKALSSWPPVHDSILETIWNASQDLLSWGRKGGTLSHRLQSWICQSCNSWNKSPALLDCIGFSMEQIPSVFQFVVSTEEKPQGRKQGVHLQKVGQNMCRNWLSWQWLEWETGEVRRSEMVHECD